MISNNTLMTSKSVFFSLCLFFLLFSTFAHAQSSSGLNEITIAYDGNPDTNFLYNLINGVGFFEKNGLSVKPIYYPTAKEAAINVMNGQADFGVLNTYSIASLVSSGEKPSILTSILKQEDIYYIVVNRDAGIQTIKDLAGKKIGLVTGDYWEYYLDRFLILNDISPESVTLVSLTQDQIVQKLNSGEIDAGVLVWASAVKVTRSNPDKFHMWSVNNKENFYLLLISTPDFVASHPDVTKDIIQAHIDLADWYAADPDPALNLFSKSSGFTLDQVKDLMKGLTAEVSLTQGLLTSLEDQTRYIINEGSAEISEVPDYLDLIDFTYLDTIRPEADTIVHD